MRPVRSGSASTSAAGASGTPWPRTSWRWGREGRGVSGCRRPRCSSPLDQPVGHDYWHLMNLAGRYAYAGREWVARKVVSILGGREVELVHNHHNFAWKERHEGEELVVIRKGATPAFPGQLGFIGGSMGDDAVIVRGAASDDPETDALQRGALFSTVHGAGRVMSRTAAAGKRHRKTGRVLSEGRVTPEMMQRLGAREGRGAAGRRTGREPACLPPAARGSGGAGKHHRGAAYAPAADRGDGRGRRVRSVQGLTDPLPGRRSAARPSSNPRGQDTGSSPVGAAFPPRKCNGRTRLSDSRGCGFESRAGYRHTHMAPWSNGSRRPATNREAGGSNPSGAVSSSVRARPGTVRRGP